MANHDRFYVFCIFKPSVQRQDMPGEKLQMISDIPRVEPEEGRVPLKLEAAIRQALGGGQPMEGNLRAQMSASLNYDFSDVRVHTDPESDELNRQLSARAFTVGSDIFFRRDVYDPTSICGRELIAHELVHVMQQRTGRVTGGDNGMTVGQADDAFEQEADALARKASKDVQGKGSKMATHSMHRPRDRGEQQLKGVPQRVVAHTYQVKQVLDAGDWLLLREMRPSKTLVATAPSRKPAEAKDRRPLIVQRTAAGFVAAAQVAPPTPGQPANGVIGAHAGNCNEAVLGWLIQSRGNISVHHTNHPWELVAEIRRLLTPPLGNSDIGRWMWTHIYNRNNFVYHNSVAMNNLVAGDILFTDGGNRPAHSMVVVAAPNPRIRAVNNLGTFGDAVAPPVPAGQVYDPHDRPIDIPMLWHSQGAAPNYGLVGGRCMGCVQDNIQDRFGVAHLTAAKLYIMHYLQAAANLDTALQHWQYVVAPMMSGWAHVGAGPCPASCPH